MAFDIMMFFYSDTLNKKYDRKSNVFFDEQSLIEEIAINNSAQQISRKINIIMELKKKIKVNANNGLLIDKLILELTGGE